MSQRPYLSVVVPTYNREVLLRITLEALAHQTYPREQFEVIVVSDGASDGTDEMVAAYARQAPYPLRLVQQVNSGVARARNRAIQEASGEVIVFLDDDIEVVPEFLALHAAHHRQGHPIAVVGTITSDPQRRHTDPPWIAWEHAMLERNYRRWRTDAGDGPGPDHFYTGNASVRRAHVLSVGGFDEDLKRQEDTELAYRMERACGVRFVFESAAVGVHRHQRSFASWLNLAYGYGQLDVACARSGRVPWSRVRDFYGMCSRVTRLLSGIILACPITTGTLRAVLLAGAETSFKLRRFGPSFAALSVIYNLRYLEGAQAELGSHKEMRRLLRGQDPSRGLTLPEPVLSAYDGG
jgi:glycosyltransferase involved in cell wall biosynthesis